MGPDGGMLSSSTVPMVQASFPQGALTKRIRVGLQVRRDSHLMTPFFMTYYLFIADQLTVE